MPFQPSPEQLKHMPKFDGDQIPRYLFRVHTPVTAGKTTTSHVMPPASGSIPEAKLDIFRESLQAAGDLLWNHLAWTRAHEPKCNFISWTSSLLFALHYAFHRHRLSDKPSELSNIRLLVLDTRGVPRGTFVKDTEIMRAITPALCQGENLHSFLSLRQDPKRDGKRYYFGEYLSQGDLAIAGRCVDAPMDMLIHAGLFEFHPGLGVEDRWNAFANRVLELREPFLDPSFPPIFPPTDRRLVRKAVASALACFGDRFALPVALMLLTLLPRRPQDENIVRGVVDMFTSKHQTNSPSRVELYSNPWQGRRSGPHLGIAKSTTTVCLS